MLAFPDEFNNDNPLADMEVLTHLRTMRASIFLVIGNLAGLSPFWYCFYIRCFFLAYSILMSIVVSCFYHLCQTTHECFQTSLPTHVSMDHFTSTSMMGLVLLSFVNTKTICQKAVKRRRRAEKRGRHRGAPGTLCGCGVEKHYHYLSPDGKKKEENMIYDAWTAASALVVITVTVVAVYAHPYSYGAFVIVIGTTLNLMFIKIMLIDEGEPPNFHGRISLPELLISFNLSAIGLTAYVLDAYREYEILHSVWHVAIYPAIMFLLAGTTKSVEGWVPLWAPFKRFVCRCFCPLRDFKENEEEEEEEEDHLHCN